MARYRFNGSNGRPFLPVADVALGVTPLNRLQSGQVVMVGNRKAKFVRNRQTGETVLVTGTGRRPFAMDAFRLSCGVPVGVVETPIS